MVQNVPEIARVCAFLSHGHIRFQKVKVNAGISGSFDSVSSVSYIPLLARFEFTRIIEDGVIQVLQPDLSKAGGITEVLRIAAMASAWKLPIHPHTSITGLNMAASIHFLASVENSGYFEADVSQYNPLRDKLVNTPFEIAPDGCMQPVDKPGIGLEVDEDFLDKHPVIEGAGYV